METKKERGPMTTVRLRKDSHRKLCELHLYRFQNNGNSIKADIVSSAVDLLYEKELGNGKKAT